MRLSRVVVVGATAMELDRRTFYEKELELRMSMSYGPGRYDRRYEEAGLDYPIEYVSWTENRNLQAFLALATHLEANARGRALSIKMSAVATSASRRSASRALQKSSTALRLRAFDRS